MKTHKISIFILALGLLLSSCAITSSAPFEREDVIERTKAEIAKREKWSETPYIVARQVNRKGDPIWLVQVDIIDSKNTDCGCGLFKPGYGRELTFSESGRLLSYKKR